MFDFSLVDLNTNANIDIKADLTKSTEDITEIAKDTHKGLGILMYALCGPTIEKRVGQAKRIAAQAEKDCLDIMEGHKELDTTSNLTVPIKDVSTLESLCTELTSKDSECKAKRLLTTIMVAAQEIKQSAPDEISDEPLNQTFFNHWRAEAELIDEDDLRDFWAHLLVEEIKKPNSISPRTLDIVKNISRKEAELFDILIQGVVNTNAIIINNSGHPLFGSFSNILSLQDARLIGAQISSSQLNANSEDSQKNKIVVIPFMENKLVVAIKKEKIIFTNYIMTTAGCEIYRISKKPLSFDQIKKISEELSLQNENAIVSIYPLEGIITDSHGHMNCHFSWTPIWTNRPTPTTSETQESTK